MYWLKKVTHEIIHQAPSETIWLPLGLSLDIIDLLTIRGPILVFSSEIVLSVPGRSGHNPSVHRHTAQPGNSRKRALFCRRPGVDERLLLPE